MNHINILRHFKEVFPYHLRVKIWFPNGKNSIRVRDEQGKELVFTYESPKVWTIETIDSFIKKMKGEK